ncbi:dabb-domain-containing protein [Podospora australis]|uniref:Dabb-domain-containing protein n=1 Tax=Podospora australis TaxID=1536484 RepID=A0AAN7AEU7_9PEZI|nr:dabb-domain-containing protein [Podospora australis]
MTVLHTVLFQLKPDATPEEAKTFCDYFYSLKKSCLHPKTMAPYIISLKGGKDNSPESDLTHGFVLEFNTVEDRDYYVFTDPAHDAFLGSIEDMVVKFTVVDFTEGVY